MAKFKVGGQLGQTLAATTCLNLHLSQLNTWNKTLPKAQRAKGIEFFDSFNIFSSKQKPQQALETWSNFTLILFGKGQEIHRTTLTNPHKNMLQR